MADKYPSNAYRGIIPTGGGRWISRIFEVLDRTWNVRELLHLLAVCLAEDGG